MHISDLFIRMSKALKHLHKVKLRACAACSNAKPESQFSNNQWRKGDGRRCKDCIDKGIMAPPGINGSADGELGCGGGGGAKQPPPGGWSQLPEFLNLKTKCNQLQSCREVETVAIECIRLANAAIIAMPSTEIKLNAECLFYKARALLSAEASDLNLLHAMKIEDLNAELHGQGLTMWAHGSDDGQKARSKGDVIGCLSEGFSSLAVARSACEMDVNNGPAHACVGVALMRRKDWAGGHRYFTDALERGVVNQGQIYENMATCLSEMCKFDEAVECAKKATTTNLHQQKHGWVLLCKILCSQGRWPEALAMTQQGLKQPGWAKAAKDQILRFHEEAWFKHPRTQMTSLQTCRIKIEAVGAQSHQLRNIFGSSFRYGNVECIQSPVGASLAGAPYNGNLPQFEVYPVLDGGWTTKTFTTILLQALEYQHQGVQCVIFKLPVKRHGAWSFYQKWTFQDWAKCLSKLYHTCQRQSLPRLNIPVLFVDGSGGEAIQMPKRTVASSTFRNVNLNYYYDTMAAHADKIYTDGAVTGLPCLSELLAAELDTESEGLTSSFDLLKLKDRWRFDSREVCAAFSHYAERASPDNVQHFLCLAVIIGELQVLNFDVSGGTEALQLFSLLIDVARMHVTSYKWTASNVHPDVNVPAQQNAKLIAALKRLLEEGQHGLGLRLTEMLAVRQFYIALSPRERKSSMQSLLSAKIKHHGVPKVLEELQTTALVELQRWDPEAFTLDDYSAALVEFQAAKLKMADVQKLLTLGTTGHCTPAWAKVRPEAANLFLRQFLKREIDGTQSSASLNTIWIAFKAHLADEPWKAFSTLAAAHIVGTFRPTEVTKWLESAAHEALLHGSGVDGGGNSHKVPSLRQLFSYLEQKQHAVYPLMDYICIFENAISVVVLRTSHTVLSDSEVGGEVGGGAGDPDATSDFGADDALDAQQQSNSEKLSSFLKSYLQAGPQSMNAWCNVLESLNNADLKKRQHYDYVGVTKLVLKNETERCIGIDKVRCIQHICDCLSRSGQTSNDVSDILNATVTKLMAGVKPEQKAVGIFLKPPGLQICVNVADLLARCINRFANREKVWRLFKGSADLAATLTKWTSVAKPEESTFHEWLILAVALTNSFGASAGDSVLPDALTTVKQKLKQLRLDCETLFTAESLKCDSFETLEQFERHNKVLQMIEETFALKTTTVYSDIQTEMKAWNEGFIYIKSQRPLLDGLQTFIPDLVNRLEMDGVDVERPGVSFRATKKEARKANSSVMVSRRTILHCWTLKFSDNRAFFEHFVVNASERADQKSILFKHFIEKMREEQTGGKPNAAPTWTTEDAFNASLSSVKSILAKLLQPGLNPLKFQELMVIGNVLKTEDRHPTDELKLLSQFFGGSKEAHDSTVIDDLATVLQLCGLKDQLAKLVLGVTGADGTLQQLSFSCADQTLDSDFKSLAGLAKDLCDVDCSWSASECRSKLKEVQDLFCPAGSEARGGHDPTSGLLCLFEHLRSADKVWEFVDMHKDFVAPDGQGCSELFNNKVEDFLSELGGEDNKVLLGFKTVVHWIAVLVSNKGKDFQTLMKAVCASPEIMKHAQQSLEKQPFFELQTMENHMDFLTELFAKGLGGLDAVLGQFQSIDKSCTYVFDLEKAELRLLYTDRKKEHQTELNHDTVVDFEQRLGFIQHEDKAQEHSIGPYLVKLQNYRRLLGVMCNLYALGHNDWVDPTRYLVEGEELDMEQTMEYDATSARIKPDGTRIKPEALSHLDDVLDEWGKKLDAESKENEYICFFSSATAQKMDMRIQNEDSYELALLLCPLVPRTALSYDKWSTLLTECSDYIEQLDTDELEESDWPTTVSHFLSTVMDSVGISQPRGRVVGDRQIPTTLMGQIQDDCNGPIRYTARPDHAELLRLLLTIYDERPPLPYEILWCDLKTTERSLFAFVERARQKPEQNFTLLQVDKLAKSLQFELLRLLLNARQTVSGFSNLHCVETGPSVLQSAPWITPKDAVDICVGVDIAAGLKSWAFEGNCISSRTGITCFHGPPGSGKTYQMKKRIEEIKSKEGENVEVFTISITEAFSLSDVSQKLHAAAVESAGKEMIVCFQINIGKFKNSDHKNFVSLMEDINKFFVRLLVLKSVEDPDSGDVFNVPPDINKDKMRVFVEIPDRHGHLEETTASSRQHRGRGLEHELPMLYAVGNLEDASKAIFDVGEDAMHVAKYLKAYDKGTIDKLYGGSSGSGGPKDLVIVLDDSGSMRRGIGTCKRCIQSEIFDKRLQSEDKVALVLLNPTRHSRPLETSLERWTGTHEARLRKNLEDVTCPGGTPLWSAVERAVEMLLRSSSQNKYIVALTDGASGDRPSNVHELLRTENGKTIRVLFITVAGAKVSEILDTCVSGRGEGNAIIPADGSLDALEQAWADVGERLTVSKQIEQDGEEITENETRSLLRKYMKLDSDNSGWSRLKQRFWIKYLYRRCGILASSEKFNKNEDLENFGSTTMQVMLDEVEQALSDKGDWNDANHEHLVYCKDVIEGDGESTVDYKWSVLATHPDATDSGWVQRRQRLKTLKMQVPTAIDLARSDRRVLDSYLAHGLGIELHDLQQECSSSGDLFDFEIGTLPTVDAKHFVLTLDFVVKMLCMNERIECRVPCIMEGETGVSKTALTRMLFTLKNAKARTMSSLERVVKEGVAASQSKDTTERSVFRKLADYWGLSDLSKDRDTWDDATELADRLCEGRKREQIVLELFNELRANPALDPLRDDNDNDTDDDDSSDDSDDCTLDYYEDDPFHRVTLEQLKRCKSDSAAAARLLKWYVQRYVDGVHNASNWAFFAVDVHAALTPDQIANDPNYGVYMVISRANHLNQLADFLDSDRHRDATLCIFFDEINTSSCMGVFKELVIDHSLDGIELPSNIVIVAACNPAREKIELAGDRREELGSEWAIGHYQVHPLPASMQHMTWDYGSLMPAQEKEFIQKRLRFANLSKSMSSEDRQTLENLIYESQQKTREFAKEHITSLVNAGSGSSISEREITARASSSVSLRDILRVFKLFPFFAASDKSGIFLGRCKTVEDQQHISMLLSIAVVYYLKLGTDSSNSDNDFRRKFCERLKGACGSRSADVEAALRGSMDALMEQTELGPGIAKTRGLKENLFMVVVCSLAQVPLMIVGPPGSSKTLAVTIADENARGQYSKSPFYKSAANLVPFRYQCSRKSTSVEIKAVFERAIQRQAKANRDGAKSKCFVFMDEAGLPEEGRESLKVLHYYLEDHMAVDAQVGFVAITNHLLDAAKSNRCALLTRAKPDHEELMNVARGCLGDQDEQRKFTSTVPGKNRRGEEIILELDPPSSDRSQDGLLSLLCYTYDACMCETRRACNDPLRGTLPPEDFVLSFGLRDFMHFIKLLGRLAKVDGGIISSEKIVKALQRSMNGATREKVTEVVNFFMEPFITSSSSSFRTMKPLNLSNPLDLMNESLIEQADASSPIGRYPLVIDTTADDSVIRAFQAGMTGQGTFCKLLKLSRFAGDSAIQQVNVISEVKWAAEKGKAIVLSQTESINESFYDLFNQHFRKFEDRTEEGTETSYFTNIAVGAHSRRCRVEKGFQCIVHLTLEELQLAPAPFLNRFEKYRLTQADLLQSHLHRTHLLDEAPGLKALLGKPDLFQHLQRFVAQINMCSFYGFAEEQTLESGLLCMLLNWSSIDDVVDSIVSLKEDKMFRSSIEKEMSENKALQFDASMLMQKPPTTIRAQIINMLQKQEADKEHESKFKIGQILIGHCITHTMIKQLLRIVMPEQLFKHPASIPQDMLQWYIAEKKHFCLKDLLLVIEGSGSTHKHIVYTRTSALVLALEMADEEAYKKLKNMVGNDGCSLLSFSRLTREPQLVSELESFVSAANVAKRALLILVDTSQTSATQINFLRYKIDEIMPLEGEKTVALVLHVPTSDILAHPCYHTTYNTQWETTFLDSMDGNNVVDWLKFSAKLPGSEEWSMLPALKSWLPDALNKVARSVDVPQHIYDSLSATPNTKLPGPGRLDQREFCFQQFLDLDLNGSSVEDILLSRYEDEWSIPNQNELDKAMNETGAARGMAQSTANVNDAYDMLRNHLQTRLHALATGELHIPLDEALTGEIKDMFVKYLSHMLCDIVENVGARVIVGLTTPGDPAQHMNTVMIIEGCIRAIQIPPFPELAAPLRPRTIQTASSSGWLCNKVPFFKNVAAKFDIAAVHANNEYAEYEGDGDVWELLIEKMKCTIELDGDPISSVIGKHYFNDACQDLPEEVLWESYVNEFVARLYPVENTSSKEPLQHVILKRWLTTQECVKRSPFKFAALHAVAQYYKSMLMTLAASFEPLARLTKGNLSETFSFDFKEEEMNEEMMSAINRTLFTEFYKIVVGIADSPPSYKMATGQDDVGLAELHEALKSWATEFNLAKLQSVDEKTPGVDFKHLDTMLVVQAAIQSCSSGPYVKNILSVVSQLNMCCKKSSAPRLTMVEIWASLEHGALTSHLGLLERLAELWLITPWGNAGIDSVFDSIVGVEPPVPPQFVSQVLETTLLGQGWGKLQSVLKKQDLSEWLNFSNDERCNYVVNYLETKLTSVSDPFLPSWINRGDAIETMPHETSQLANGVFQLIFKWLQIYHSDDELNDLAFFARNKLWPNDRDQTPHLRRIACSAAQVLVVDRLACRIADNLAGNSLLNDEQEYDRLLDILANPIGEGWLWSSELARSLYIRCSGDAEQARVRLQRLSEEEPNKVLKEWLEESNVIMGTESSALTRKRHILQPALIAEGARKGSCMSQLERFPEISQRHVLRCLWVVPDLIEFYEMITSEISKNHISENDAKEQSLKDILDGLESNGSMGDAVRYLQLWPRVKVGVNNFLKHLQRDEDQITEDLSLWSMLSTDSMDTNHRSDCLYSVLADMIEEYKKCCQTSISSGVSLPPTHESRPLDVLAELDCNEIQESFNADLNYEQVTNELQEEVRCWTENLDFVGPLSRKVVSKTFAETPTKPLATSNYDGLFGVPVQFREAVAYRVLCTFEDTDVPSRQSSAQSQVQWSHFQLIYHALDYNSLRALISALRPLAEYMFLTQDDGEVEEGASAASGVTQTVNDVLQELYPGASKAQYLSQAYIDIADEKQRSALLNTPADSLQQLVQFFNNQIFTEAYLFAHKDFALKQPWSETVESKLDELKSSYSTLSGSCLTDDARRLQSILVKYEQKITASPEQGLIKCLAKLFKSESDLLKQVPLLGRLTNLAAEITRKEKLHFDFTGAHYVKLRQKLRIWESRQPTTTIESSGSWDWPFMFVPAYTLQQQENRIDDSGLKARMIPWFLVDPPEIQARKREDAEKKLHFEKIWLRAAIAIQCSFRCYLARKEHQRLKDLKDAATSQCEGGGRGKPGGRRGGGRGGGRGRGRGKKKVGKAGASSGLGFGALVQARAQQCQQTKSEQESMQNKLSTLCSKPSSQPYLLKELSMLVKEALEAGLDAKDAAFKHAYDKKVQLEAQQSDARTLLMNVQKRETPDLDKLVQAIKKAESVGIPRDDGNMGAAQTLLRRLEEAVQRKNMIMSHALPSLELLQDAIKSLQELRLSTDDVEKQLRQCEAEEANFYSQLKHRYNLDSEAGIRILMADFRKAFSTPLVKVVPVPSSEYNVKKVESIFKKISADDGTGISFSSDDKWQIIEELEQLETQGWLPALAYKAMVNATDNHIEDYRQDAEKDAQTYLVDMMNQTEASAITPGILLACARLCIDGNGNDRMFRISCLRRCHISLEIQNMMTEGEREAAELRVGERLPQPSSGRNVKMVDDSPEGRWLQLKTEASFTPCEAVDELMKLIGLKSLKLKVLELYASVRAEQQLPKERRVPQTHNFALLGNPGTGKTTIAKLLGKMLKELGVRTSDSFEITTGEKLARMGASKVSELIDSATGGVLFVDEAYALDPASNADAAAAAMQLLDVAEERRTDLTIILAGYKDDMERKLFDFNDGFDRRFNYQYHFDDFNECELAAIFQAMCTKHNWQPGTLDVVNVAARRVARGRDIKGFGNAGAVRTLFETAYRRALTRDPNAQTLEIIDIVGPRPDRQSVPDLDRALNELDQMIGLAAVKKKIMNLVQLAATNYDRELSGDNPYPVLLNRVFLGNPGTGKTTVAKIYGRVLKAAGFLSDGAAELKQPSDFIGSVVGETQKRTSSLIKRCKGKVLIIDEAYALNSHYGHEAIDTLVGLVYGAPGENIAVVMIGYEKQMKKMFREVNEGLTRRFGLDDPLAPLQFDDFSDADLDRVLLREIRSDGNGLKFEQKSVRTAVIKALGVQRSRPNFGNAGAAVSLVARAKERMVSRDSASKILTLADFGLDSVDGDGFGALDGLYRVDHIKKELSDLKAVIGQCKADGKDPSEHLTNYVFLGKPGTGKTTIARAMASMLHDIGILATDTVVCMSGLDLQAECVGQTKTKVNAAMDEAQGGVLFIDEAYSLVGGTVYAKEAIDQLVERMTSQEHLHKTVVIFAGYKEEMENMLATANTGLKSRVTGRIEFPDWSAADCVQMVKATAECDGIQVNSSAEDALLEALRTIAERPGWSNARDCILTTRLLYAARARRLLHSSETAPSYNFDDVGSAMGQLFSQRPHAPAQSSGGSVTAAIAVQAPVIMPPQNEQQAPVFAEVVNLAEEVEHVEAVEAANDGADAVFTALLLACRDAGYDKTHEARKDLICILKKVQGGENFPRNIIEPVLKKTGLPEGKVIKILRPQIAKVVDGMSNAVRVEEERREELRRLEEEERKQKEEEYKKKQEQLRTRGPCPMGYSWHRCGGRWRCAGGSHYVADSHFDN